MRWLLLLLLSVLNLSSCAHRAHPASVPLPKAAKVTWPKLPEPAQPKIKFTGQAPQDLGVIKGWRVHSWALGETHVLYNVTKAHYPFLGSTTVSLKAADRQRTVSFSGAINVLTHHRAKGQSRPGTVVLLGGLNPSHLMEGKLIKRLCQQGWEVVWHGAGPIHNDLSFQ